MLRMMRYCDKFVPVTNICILSCEDETGLHMTRTAVFVVLGMVRRVDWTKVVVIIRLLKPESRRFTRERVVSFVITRYCKPSRTHLENREAELILRRPITYAKLRCPAFHPRCSHMGVPAQCIKCKYDFRAYVRFFSAW